MLYRDAWVCLCEFYKWIRMQRELLIKENKYNNNI